MVIKVPVRPMPALQQGGNNSMKRTVVPLLLVEPQPLEKAALPTCSEPGVVHGRGCAVK